jgi:Fe-S-cluster containining protein
MRNERRKGPNMPQERRVSCASCISACCLKYTVLPLTPVEAAQLREDGSQLVELPKWTARRTPRGTAAYLLQEDCANLQRDEATGDTSCAKYDQRPQACRNFEAGDTPCLEMRDKRMADVPQQWAPLPLSEVS